MPDTTVYLKDYLPPTYAVESVDLNFDLYDDHALVSSELKITREHSGDLVLYGDDLQLISIEMNGVVLKANEYRMDGQDLVLASCPDQAILKIVTRIYPQKNTQLSGLYRSNHLFCTQCEAEGFRRMTFFPDRPDVLATYSTRITADKEKYPVLLSNGNLIEGGDLDDGRHWVLWQDPFKKPSYLFALVAGNLAHISDTFVTQSGRAVDLEIYVEPGNEDKCHHAMESLKKSMRWDEEVYGREYDLDIFMIVAVSDFNMGAMENKGLNIFNSKYILASPDSATDQDFANVEGVVGHEYFHNWTGNRVTCRDWFQLSLKEGLTVFRDQEFSRDMNSRDVNRIMDVKMLRMDQFPEDASSMAHPVRPASYQEINNFYTATIYNKGAEVIRMQHTLLGEERYRRGMDLYFNRHDGQAVTIDDFVAAMEDANHFDLTQFKLWYSQAGTPEVEVKCQFENNRFSLKIKQSCPPTPECQQKLPFHIPIKLALFDADGQALLLENDVFELKEAEHTFELGQFAQRPIVSLLREFSAPVKLKDDHTEQELLFLLRHETDGFAKWDAAQKLVLNHLSRCLNAPNQVIDMPMELISAFKHVLMDEGLDSDLRAELLTPPEFEEVAATQSVVDVGAIESVRDTYRKQLGEHLFDEASKMYQKLWSEEDHAMHGAAYGRRKLRNMCLRLMMKSNETETQAIVQHQFTLAKTMTDQLAAFTLLVNGSNQTSRLQAIDSFYKQWSSNDLVMDKWFAVQASSELPETLAHIKELMNHREFSMTNPNKVRSVIGVFCMANPRHFHAIDGSGYAFLREMLTTLDAINPQVASRLATPFTRWQRLDKKRQELMIEQLKQLATLELSRDLREVVDKSLAPTEPRT